MLSNVSQCQQQQSYSELRSPGHIQPTYEMTPGLKPFTNQHLIDYELIIHILLITDS